MSSSSTPVCPWLNNPTVTAGSILFTISDTDSASPDPDTGVWQQGIIVGSQAGTGKPIPTLGTWGLLVLGVMMAGAGLFILRRLQAIQPNRTPPSPADAELVFGERSRLGARTA